MIIRRFLQWTAGVSAESRAQGAAALARAFVDGEFDPEEENEAVSTLVSLLDDRAPVVRLAIALEVASAPHLPPALAAGLIADRADIAAILLEFSPVPTRAELVDAVAMGDSVIQCAVGRRADVGVGLAAALAEVAGLEACVELCRNAAATIPDSALARIIDRFGDDAGVRMAVAGRPDLAPALRHALVQRTARSLATFVTDCGWLGAERAVRVTGEATAQACVVIATAAQRDRGLEGVMGLVRHLRGAGCLTPALLLQALLCGQGGFFECGVSELAGVPLARVAGLVGMGRGLGFRALYDKAGLPASLRPAFAAALDQPHEITPAAGDGPRRERIRAVLAACGKPGSDELASLALLLRRLDAQVARAEARGYARAVMEDRAIMRPSLPEPGDRRTAMPSAA